MLKTETSLNKMLINLKQVWVHTEKISVLVCWRCFTDPTVVKKPFTSIEQVWLIKTRLCQVEQNKQQQQRVKSLNLLHECLKTELIHSNGIFFLFSFRCFTPQGACNQHLPRFDIISTHMPFNIPYGMFSCLLIRRNDIFITLSLNDMNKRCSKCSRTTDFICQFFYHY